LRQPRRIFRRRKYASHNIGFSDARRQKILTGRFVIERTVAILQIELANLARDQRCKRWIGSSRVVEDQAKCKSSLRVFTFANGIRELWKPRVELTDNCALQRLQRQSQRRCIG